MRKPTQLVLPAFVLGTVLLVGGYRLTARPTAAAQLPAAPAASTTKFVQLTVSPIDLAVSTGRPVETQSPTQLPTATAQPTQTAVPSPTATAEPVQMPTDPPTAIPTAVPTDLPTALPTNPPADSPIASPTDPPAAPHTAAPAQVVPLQPPDRIVAPAIGLDSKVVTVGWHEVRDANGGSHTEWDVASYSAGWHKNSALPGQIGNTVVAAHNNIEGEIFHNLGDFQLGDEITLSAGGRRFTYVVSNKFVVQEKDVPYEQRLANDKWIGFFPDARLTLISCWPPTSNTHRMFIIALLKQ
jgi:sortase A